MCKGSNKPLLDAGASIHFPYSSRALLLDASSFLRQLARSWYRSQTTGARGLVQPFVPLCAAFEADIMFPMGLGVNTVNLGAYLSQSEKGTRRLPNISQW